MRAPGRVLAAVVAILAATLALTIGEPRADPAVAGEATQPNVVVIMTDDQDAASLAVMESVNRQLQGVGTTFENAYSSTPLCCPSRATFLTGEYSHNHGVLDNFGANGGYGAFTDAETALPVELSAAGYRTGLVGKYLNGYQEGSPVPPGWDYWRGAIGSATEMYRYDLMDENGALTRYGARADDYRTDVYAYEATKFIRESSALGEPFFLTVTPGAPHVERRCGSDLPPRPAPRHEGDFASAPLPRPPSFNEADVTDKPAAIQAMPLMDTPTKQRLRVLYRARLASLQAVDDLVMRVVRTLRFTGDLDETMIVFTSDNGFLLGEHRIARKGWLYEESAQVPLILRGPGIPAETRLDPVANVDLAPTILEAAGAVPQGPVDGRSLLQPPLEAGRDVLLENLESGSRGGMTVVRSSDGFVYMEHPSGERELYDLAQDPFQLDNRQGDPAYAAREAELSLRLEELERCAEATC